MKRPRALTFLAWVFILFGCSAGWRITEALLSHKTSINLSILMIPVGIGLLKGRLSSLGWAKLWIGLFFLLVLAITCAYPFDPGSYSVTWFGAEIQGPLRHLAVVGISATLMGLLLWGWRILEHIK